MSVANQLINSHIAFTNFLAFLESITLPTTTYQNLTFSQKNQVSLSVTAPSFTLAAEQILAFKQAKNGITEIQTQGMKKEQNQEEERIHFEVQLKIVGQLLTL